MRFRLVAALIPLLCGVAGLVGSGNALAQGAGPQPAPPADTGAATAPAATTAAPAAPATPSTATPAGSDAPAKPVVPATGYGWSTHPAKGGGHAPRVRSVKDGPATGRVVPGFETLADGSSRAYVQLPKPTTFTTQTAAGSLVYVLKGVHIDRRNNLNALVTVHFNTPVTSARLVPHGGDLWFVLELRANVTPTVAMDAAKDGGAMFRVEFPKGDYLSMPVPQRVTFRRHARGGPAAPTGNAPTPSGGTP